MPEIKKSKIMRAIQEEVVAENRREQEEEVVSQCSETNCSTYCSDYSDTDHH